MRCLCLFLLLLSHSLCAQNYIQYDTIGDPSTALQKLKTAVIKDAGNAELYFRIADKYFQLQHYDSCITNCNQSISLLAKSVNNNLLANVLLIKGRAQYYLDDKEQADANWRQGLALAQQEKNGFLIAKLATNAGVIYLDETYLKRNNIHGFHLADSFLLIAYKQLKADDSLSGEQGLRTQRLMATSLHFQKKYDSASAFYEKIISLSKHKSTTAYVGSLSFYAEMLSEMGKHELALFYIKEAARFAAENKLKSKDYTHIAHVYGQVLHNKGDFAQAYKFVDSSYQLLASDYQKLNTQAYAESESKFKNQLLQYQVQLEKQEKNKLYFVFGGIVLLAALLFLFYQNKNNKRIAMEKAAQKQISIDAFIEGEEKEKVRIGRELHDGIAQEIVAVKLAMEQLKADPKLIEELRRISMDIRNISHELMPQTLKDYGLKLAIEDICQKILGPSGIRFEIHTSLPEERLADKIEITLYRVFQELVHNIIKHSKATEVMVQLRKMNNHVLLVVEDNGKGMGDEKRNGIGINNLKSRVQLLDGNLEYDSSDNEGTTAIVRVPL